MSGEKRITGPDELRGFALLGICVVNLPLLARSWESFQLPPETAFARAGIFINSLFFEAKFFGLFSFLFGVGLYLILQSGGLRSLLRRLIVLFSLGLAHAVLFFPGDILVSYALLGMVLVLLRNLRTRTLLTIAGISLALSAATYYALGLLASTNPAVPPVDYATTFSASVSSNAAVYPLAFGYVMLFNWPLALAMFCVGYVTMREGYLARLLPSRVIWWALPIGFAGNAFYAITAAWQIKHLMHWSMLCLALSAPLLSYCYAVLIFSLAHSERFALIANFLAAPGRMSLSNYLGQSILAGVIFHGYGFRLYGKISYGGLIFVSLGIFLALAVFSLCWLRFFKLGPAEMLMRSLNPKPLTHR